MNRKAIEEYRQWRDRLDAEVRRLAGIHAEYLVCGTGCCGCCDNLSVFPVEFYSIVEEMRELGLPRPKFDEAARCGFLKDGLCQIYPVRPKICRTHGLPLAFLNDELDPPEMSVTFCEKNFAGADFERIRFGPDNTLNVDGINEELGRLNIAFIEQNPELGLERDERIELKRLVEDQWWD